jgi:preprotein translocase subunit SecB
MEPEQAIDTKETAEERPQINAQFPLYRYQLREVKLWETHIERLAEAAEKKPTGDLSMEARLEIELLPAAFSALLTVTVECAYNEEGARYRLVVAFQGTFQPRDDTIPLPTEEDLDSGLGATAFVLIWPYAREFVQNLTQRMQVQVRTLPMVDGISLASSFTAVDNEGSVEATANQE